MLRVRQGTIYRFDSVAAAIAFCRHRYRTDDLDCSSRDGDLLLHVKPTTGESFESLVVHFEGEQAYAVMLPEP